MQTGDRASAVALIGGSALYLAVAALHPTHGAGAAVAVGITLSELVHGLALITGPVLLLGVLGLSRAQGLERWPVLLSLLIYGFGAVAGVLAPMISGLVAPRMMSGAHGAASAEAWSAAAHLGFYLNQAAATVHYALASAAVLLWSAAWRGRSPLDWVVRAVGALVGGGVLAWVLSGPERLGVHSLGAIVLGHGAWAALAAVWLLRRSPPAPAKG